MEPIPVISQSDAASIVSYIREPQRPEGIQQANIGGPLAAQAQP